MLARTVISVFVLLLSVGVAEAKKVALVIGNSAYRNAIELPNPVNDARAMGAKLEALGFEVVSGYDQDYPAMQATVNSFAREAIGADIALLFYAGHGMQVRGQNYIIPIDAAFKDETALDFEAISVDFIVRQMSRDVRLRMVFLDACRDNPLAKVLASSMSPSRSVTVSSGLAEIKIDEPGEGTVIAFATSPGDVAYDGKSEHSPFTTALLAHIDARDLPLQNVLTRVTKDVFEATNQKQRPWFNASLIGEIYLNKSPKVEVAALGKPELPGDPDAPVEPKLSISATSELPARADPVAWDQEKTLFEFAQKSGEAEDFEAYLASYPKGHFADIARNFIQRSRSVAVAPKVASVEEDGLTPRRPFPEGTGPVVDAPLVAPVVGSVPAAPAPVPVVAALTPAAPSASPKPVEPGTDLTETLLNWDKQRRREVQKRLELDGIAIGKVDGSFGPKTRQAVASWQTARGLAATGYFNASQFELLVSRTLQSYAAFELDQRNRTASAAQSARPGKTRSVQKASPQRPRAVSKTKRQRVQKPQRTYVRNEGPVRRRDNGGNVAGAAFVGGLIGGAIGGAIGR